MGPPAGSNKRQKKQGTMDSLLGLPTLPSYFVLRPAPDGGLVAEWVAALPSGEPQGEAEWRAEARFGTRHATLVSLATAGADGESDAQGHRSGAREGAALSEPPAVADVPMLKSLLQKAVRRRHKRAAVWAAAALLELSADDLLRRLPIVALEDVGLCGGILPALVWMMAAHTKGWTPGPRHMLWLLNAVASLCEVAEREVPGAAEQLLVSDRQLLARCGGGGAPPAGTLSLMLSLNARLEYGGMASDMHMIKWYMNTWHSRLQEPQRSAVPVATSGPPLSTFVSALPVAPLPLSGWLLPAIDFHCSDVVPRVLAAAPHLRLSMRLSPDELASLMWDFSSSVNSRALLPGSAPAPCPRGSRPRWDAVRQAVMKAAHAILQEKVAEAAAKRRAAEHPVKPRAQ
eukprot:jgi/Tetstr1/460436/TSEL_005695.t1